MTVGNGTGGATGSQGGARGERRGGPPAWFAALATGGLVLAGALIIAQVIGIGAGGAAAPATIAPTGDAAQRTADLVVKTLTAAGLQVAEPQTAYRPGESPALVGVPRRVLQAVLPSDPSGGYVVIYELPSNGEADTAGRDFARYLASGTGAIQYPQDAQFVLRRVGQTLVFFPWSPSVSPDPEAARLASTLSGIGEPLPAS